MRVGQTDHVLFVACAGQGKKQGRKISSENATVLSVTLLSTVKGYQNPSPPGVLLCMSACAPPASVFFNLCTQPIAQIAACYWTELASFICGVRRLYTFEYAQ